MADCVEISVNVEKVEFLEEELVDPLERQMRIEVEEHRRLFNEWLNVDPVNKTEKRTSKIIDRKKALKIIQVLKGHKCDDNNFKFFIKKNKYEIINENGREILTREIKENVSLPVGIKEDFFDILHDIHSVQRGHCGIIKTTNVVNLRYFGIPRRIVNKFIYFCSVCNRKNAQAQQNKSNTINSSQLWSCIQFDLVDMSHSPNGEFNWIAHVEDNFSKYRVLWPIKDKSAEQISDGLLNHVFPYFGLPKIIQLENGLEFCSSSITSLIEEWGGHCKIVPNNPRQLQSLENVLASYKDTNWIHFLPKIMYNLNNEICFGNLSDYILRFY